MRITLSAVLLVALASVPAGASVVYQFTIDTTMLSASSGYIDLQFNPGDASSQALVAQVAALDLEGGTLDGAPQISGNISGALPGPVTFGNDPPSNEYFQGVTFSSAIKFTLTLSGPGLDMPDSISLGATTFALGFLDSGMNSVLTNDPSGSVAQINIFSDGSTNAVFFPNAIGGPSAASATLTPEPSTGWLCIIAIGALSAALKSRKRRRAFRSRLN